MERSPAPPRSSARLPTLSGRPDRWLEAVRRHELLSVSLATVAFCILIWIWRRPGQLTHPYIWDEESLILRHYLDGGFIRALRPIEGYLILPPAVLLAVAAKISIVHLPELEYVFALLVFVGTVLMIVPVTATSISVIPRRLRIALLVLMRCSRIKGGCW